MTARDLGCKGAGRSFSSSSRHRGLCAQTQNLEPDPIAVARSLRTCGRLRAPATQGDFLASPEPIGDLLDFARLRAALGKIAIEIALIGGDHAQPLLHVSMVAKNVRIAENRIAAIDVDDCFIRRRREPALAFRDDADPRRIICRKGARFEEIVQCILLHSTRLTGFPEPEPTYFRQLERPARAGHLDRSPHAEESAMIDLLYIARLDFLIKIRDALDVGGARPRARFVPLDNRDALKAHATQRRSRQQKKAAPFQDTF